MSYPDLPNNRLIVNGVDLSIRFQMVLLDGYTLSPPKPKTYTVDIPGGNGVIDLTESLTGDVAYNQREQEFIFAVIDVDNFEKVKTEVSNFLHGKAFDYTMTMDPGYTYHGRFSVEEYSHSAYSDGIVGSFKVKVVANPYKLKEQSTYKLNATGGHLFRLWCGRRPVHPTFECTETSYITWNGEEIVVPSGTYRLNDVLFKEGWNEIWINTNRLFYTTWGEVAEDGNLKTTWDEAKELRWDEIGYKLTKTDSNAPRCWNDIMSNRWTDFSDKTWSDMNYSLVDVIETIAYMQYNVEDL